MQPVSATPTARPISNARISVILMFGVRYGQRRCAASLELGRRLFLFAPRCKLVKQEEEQRDENERQGARPDHAADDAGAERMPRVHARAQGDPERHATED